MASNSSLSPVTTLASAGHLPSCAPAALTVTALPCQRRQIARKLPPNRSPSRESRLKLHGVQTSSVAAVATLCRAAAPEWILTRPPTVTACRGRHFALRVKQTLINALYRAQGFCSHRDRGRPLSFDNHRLSAWSACLTKTYHRRRDVTVNAKAARPQRCGLRRRDFSRLTLL